jgi:formylmethanofuran dehydrogenase subunit A
VNPKALEGTALMDGLDREYSLSEIAIITRAGPARLLGLTEKGHLGVGADADLAIYADQADREAMFLSPRHVLKGGERIASGGDIRAEIFGRTLHVAPGYDAGVERKLRDLVAEEGTLALEDYRISEDELRRG